LPKQETLKNTKEWLHGFIVFTGLHYQCATSQQQSRDGNGISHNGSFDSNGAQEVSKLHKDIGTLQNVVSGISGSLAQLANEVSSIASKLQVSSDAGPNEKSGQPLAYPGAVSTTMLKAAITEAMREQQMEASDKATVATYGFPEDGPDQPYLREMLQFLNCPCNVICSKRVGQPGNAASALRPIKLEIKAASDASILLSKAKNLRLNDYYAGIYINKWLSEDEMQAVKLERKRCYELNQQHPVAKGERKKYIVISGVLNVRNSNGQLKPIDPAKSQTRRSSKNGQGGSHGAPS
jgi:hypothetical protein